MINKYFVKLSSFIKLLLLSPAYLIREYFKLLVLPLITFFVDLSDRARYHFLKTLKLIFIAICIAVFFAVNNISTLDKYIVYGTSAFCVTTIFILLISICVSAIDADIKDY